MIFGALSYAPFSHGPTPSPPNASQSLAPTGCTPSSSAVSASPQPRATTRFGAESIVVVPSPVVMETGKAPSDEPPSEESDEDGVLDDEQPERTRVAATTAPAAASTRPRRRLGREVRITKGSLT